MLLTSSQVGVLLSSFIVLIFTFALFLSGYVLQQHTVTHLRAAIRPASRPVHNYSPGADVWATRDDFAQTPSPAIAPDTVLDADVPVIDAVRDDAEDRGEQATRGSGDAQAEGKSKWDIIAAEVAGPDDDGVSGGKAGSDETRSRAQEADGNGDAYAIYVALDAAARASHEKLSAALLPSPRPSQPDLSPSTPKSSPSLSSQSFWSKISQILLSSLRRRLNTWRGIKPEEDVDFDVPLESLTGAARRRRIKADIKRLGSLEEVDQSKLYRPRRRAW